MNRQHFEFEKSVRFNVSNETMQEKKILLKWQVRNAAAEVLKTEEEEIMVPPLTAVWREKEVLPQVDVFEQYVSFQAYEEGKEISDGTVIFSYPKYFRYQDPHLEAVVQGKWITVRAKTYAKSVEIQNEMEDLVLSDNYFDMNGGEKRVRILRGKPERLRLRCVYDIK